MESEIIHSRSLDQHHEQEPHHVVGHHHDDEDEDRHGKKSVLTKVKAKAKKIKDKIKKHGHGDHHDEHHHGQHIPDDHDLGEDDDDGLEEEEMVDDDPEIHGAPIYESATLKNAVPGQADYVAHPPGVHFERSNATREEPLALSEKYGFKSSDPFESVITEPPKVGFGSKMALGEANPSQANRPISADRSVDRQPESLFTPRTDHHKGTDQSIEPSRTFVDKDKLGKTKVNLGRSMSLEEDPHGPSRMSRSSVPSNAQSKVAEPPGAGTEEVGVTPIIDVLGKVKFHDESEDKAKAKPCVFQDDAETHSRYQFPSAGSHDQFNPESMGNMDATRIPSVSGGHPHQEPIQKQANQDSYTAKMSSAITAIADKAASAKNVLASKLGHGENDENKHIGIENEVKGGEDGSHGTTESASAMEYGKKIASTVTEKLTPVYEKVAWAGSAAISKAPINEEGEVVKQDKGVSVTDYFSEKLRPGEEDKALSEVISHALHNPKAELSKTEERPLRRVTESSEVANQLGTGDEITAKREQESYVDTPGTGVIDKLIGAVGSWFGGSQESQSSKGDEALLRNTGEDVGKGTSAEEGRMFQESSN